MSQPRIEQGPGIYRFTWDMEQVQIAVTRAHEFKERATAELTITTTAPGVPTHLHQAQVNLTSTRGRAELAKHLHPLYKGPDWLVIIEQTCHHVLDRMRKGEPIVVLSTAREAKRPQWALWPLIPRRNPMILFGKGGSGKSILAMAASMVLQLAWQDNQLGLRPLAEPLQTLYLDWEMNEDDAQWRLQCIARGLGLANIEVRYRRCAAPLAEDIEGIQEIMLDEGIDFVVLDSIFGAAGGDLNATEPAQRMFAALRSLNTTSMLLGHCAKNSDERKEATPFGNAFYWNEARSIWEIQKVQEVGESELEVGLFNRKSNFAGLHKPVGYRIAFLEESIEVRRHEVEKIAELADRLPVRVQITSALKRGRMSVKDLAEELSIDPSTIRQTLNRMEDRNQVVRLGMDWALSAEKRFGNNGDLPF